MSWKVLQMSNYITAKEAHEKTQAKVVERRAFELNATYVKIREAISAGRYRTSCIASNYELGDYIFNKLVADNYYVEMHVVIDGGFRLAISWEDVEDDPDKRYILPLDDAKSFGGGSFYAFVDVDKGNWTIDIAPTNEDASDRGYTVAAKDLEDAPDWVKAIKPIEVKQ